MATDWDEIRRLASDLQRAQLRGAIQKLSERNCIEIVTNLIGQGLLEVLYTADGKEYLTAQQLNREIRDELFVARGRISLVELAQILNVDFSHVEYQAQSIAKPSGPVHLILGQLVDSRYLDSLAEEVNEKLQLEGILNLSNLAKEADLPGDFIQEQIGLRLGKVIEGFADDHDPRVILTSSYLQRNKAKIRGILSAVTVPSPVAQILNHYHIQEQLFFSLADDLIQSGRISGAISGGKRANKATYIPHSYAKAQSRWVDDFWRQNGYLEYDALTRLGLSDPEGYVRKRFKEDTLTFLSSCCVSSQVEETIEASIDETLAVNNWLDLSTFLPSVLSEEDGQMLVQKILERKAGSQGYQLFGHVVLFPQAILDKVEESFDALVKEQAQKDLASKEYEKILSGGSADKFEADGTDNVDKKEERRKKATGGKGGGGTQGRETKTKSTKKKYGKGRKGNDDSDDEEAESGRGTKRRGAERTIQLMDLDSLEAKLGSIDLFRECPEDAFADMAQFFHPRLNQKFKSLLVELYQSSQQISVHDRRKAHGQLQESCNANVTLIRICEKAIGHFHDEEGEEKPLQKHLLKTLCTDLVNEVFAFVRDDHGLEIKSNSTELNSDQRLKILKDVPKEIGEPLHEMHKALSTSATANDFLTRVEELLETACDVYIRKPDKKKDRQLIFNHRQSVVEQLNASHDEAMTLHLAVTLLFQINHGTILHASGKFVPQIIKHLSTFIPAESLDMLKEYESLVMSLITNQEGREETKEQLTIMTPKVKSLVSSFKKSSSKGADGGE